MQYTDRKIKILLSISALAVVLILVYVVLTAYSRIGKTEVVILANPEDSIIKIDGKKISSGKMHLSPGKYAFSAERAYFEVDYQEIIVRDEAIEVFLVPKATSKEAKEFLKSNPETQKQREAYGGERFEDEGKELSSNYPIFNHVPTTVLVGGPFTIDVGIPNDENNAKNEPFIEVRTITPDGRKAALDWISNHDQEITDIKILFVNYVSPLNKEDVE